jgi:hypothetical protein
MREDFLDTPHLLPSHFLHFFCPTRVSILWRICVCIYIHTSDSVQTVYESPLLPNNTRSRDSTVGIATRYGLEGPGIESRWGEIFRTYPDHRLRGPPSLLYNGYRVFPGGKGGRGVILTTHPLLVPRLRKSWAIPPLTLWVLLGLLRGSLYLYTLPNNNAVKQFTQIGAVRSVDWIFIVGAPVWRWLGECVTLDRTFYSLLLKQEAVTAQLLPHFVTCRILTGSLY